MNSVKLLSMLTELRAPCSFLSDDAKRIIVLIKQPISPQKVLRHKRACTFFGAEKDSIKAPLLSFLFFKVIRPGSAEMSCNLLISTRLRKDKYQRDV